MTLLKRLFESFDFDGFQSEEEYINTWLEQCEKEDSQYSSPAYEAIPYAEGFGEDGDDEFEFIEDYDDDFINTKSLTKIRTSKKNQLTDERLWLLSPKSNKALNTQFKRTETVTLHPALGFQEEERVKLSTECGNLVLKVKLSEDIRENCVLITSNTIGINRLTPSLVSNEGENACYQEVKVAIERVVSHSKTTPKHTFKSDKKCIEFLFELYEVYVGE